MTPPHGRYLPDESLAALLIESVVDYAIFVLDEHGRVRTWNAGAERVKGYRAEEIIGRDFSVFYTDADREDGLPSRLLAQAAGEGRVIHTGWRVRKDGTRFYGDVTITALRADDGELRGFAKVTRDRTAEHDSELAMARALERERQAAQELTRLDESRTKFMAAVSHDLQTPIGAILGSVELLPGSDLDDEVGPLMAVIRRNAERLQGMASQLSEISRLERGFLPSQPEPTDLGAAARECVETLGPLVSDVDVRVEATGVAHVDPRALDRILTNLVTNAAQHSPDARHDRHTSRGRDGRRDRRGLRTRRLGRGTREHLRGVPPGQPPRARAWAGPGPEHRPSLRRAPGWTRLDRGRLGGRRPVLFQSPDRTRHTRRRRAVQRQGPTWNTVTRPPAPGSA